MGGEALLRLINDILDFSKIEAGKLTIEIIDFDLRATLEDVSELLAVRAQEKGLELVCLIDPDVPSFVRGDPGRIRQVLINIIGNAVKFTSSGEVSVRVEALEERDDKAVIRFTVMDTGIGIPENKIESLFTPFTQIDASDTRQYEGTGLDFPFEESRGHDGWGDRSGEPPGQRVVILVYCSSGKTGGSPVVNFGDDPGNYGSSHPRG